MKALLKCTHQTLDPPTSQLPTAILTIEKKTDTPNVSQRLPVNGSSSTEGIPNCLTNTVASAHGNSSAGTIDNEGDLCRRRRGNGGKSGAPWPSSDNPKLGSISMCLGSSLALPLATCNNNNIVAPRRYLRMGALGTLRTRS